jgi:hypothetical protein
MYLSNSLQCFLVITGVQIFMKKHIFNGCMHNNGSKISQRIIVHKI